MMQMQMRLVDRRGLAGIFGMLPGIDDLAPQIGREGGRASNAETKPSEIFLLT